MKKGGPCPWPVQRCPVPEHADWRRQQQPKNPAAPPAPAPAATPIAPEPEEFPWLGGRDLRALGWWLIEHVLRKKVEAHEGSVVANLVRTLAALGPEDADTEDALREVELRGVLMHGMPPRTEDEWARAARSFDDDALAEFHRWEKLLLEADHRDRPEPFDFGEVRAGDVEVPGFIDDEDGG